MLRSVSQGVNEIVWGNFAETVTLKCKIKDAPFNCMVDSGAGCSLLTKGAMERIPNAILSPADRILKDASQNVIKLCGKTTLPVTIIYDNHKVVKRDVTLFCSRVLRGSGSERWMEWIINTRR